MGQHGRVVSLYLLNGSVTGVIKYTLPNWTGIIYKIPRPELESCKKRADLQQSGVYFLFGKSDENNENVVYVGQAGIRKNGNGLLGRILEHARSPEKNYWTEAVAVTTSNNSFGPTEISYLENQFTQLALSAKRYIVKNGNDPNPGNITEEKESELQEFIDYAKIVMGILGHKVFIPLDEVTDDKTLTATTRFFLKKRGAEASGVLTSEGFVVLKGSKLNSKSTQSCPDWLKKLRMEYSNRISKDFILTEDIVFNSPSAAAGFCVFGAENGRTAWKNESKKTLKELDGAI
ncbi:GIY-YIG nuclease family protein [uncultured Victivallis sp.]|uniref:GIY-YIG nuclease family protein n=1 Tax=uncultured Victivallis sp. TaxID=354118 RepID=UPI0025CF3016|nr:GIY-YIG nuclease family protein [uncultured Victivallis sp.]